MFSTLSIALALTLLQCHTVLGDFGIPPVITDALTLQEYANNVVDEVQAIENSSADIPTDGPEPDFNAAGVALKAVFEQIVVLMRPIGQSLGNLAVNDVGPVETLFGDTDTKIGAMLTFIANTLPGLLVPIEPTVSIYVRNELYDMGQTIKGSLGKLRSALNSLRTGVINARTAAASNRGVYTSSIIQNNVKSSLVDAVLKATLDVHANLPSVELSASESARTILTANFFFESATAIASGESINEVWEGELLNDYQLIMDFKAELQALVDSELPLVKSRLGSFATEFSALVDPLDTQYDEVSSVFGDVLTGIDANVLNGYKTLVASANNFINDVVEHFFPPIEPAIKQVSQSLISRGPYGEYCYETFYPKVEVYLSSVEMSVVGCLNTEIDRQKSLREALLEVIYELKFFLEDTNEYLNTCYRVSQFDEQLGNECLEEHTDFSTIIPCTTIKEYATLLELLCKEVDSIRFRLWRCMSRNTAQFPIAASNMLLQLEACRISGQFSPV
ncbi:uncharacterized protein LOC131285825 [Anopheles ziemanni]|uniref:uncharacterized protein LOC131269479 n=1 Tax=Anopheles coustani TaxID=139045 RepID=UPI0026593AC1|nr:uncharacterized protein LOC131269479 [Anopheles coustani]XP_058170663.1 uncharacterized protein LOC131285825 [Anopheles ziemanni]